MVREHFALYELFVTHALEGSRACAGYSRDLLRMNMLSVALASYTCMQQSSLNRAVLYTKLQI